MTAEASVYRYWWGGVLGVMAGCLSLAVASLPAYMGAAASLGLFGGLVAAAGFLAPRLLEGVQGPLRWIVNPAIPTALVIGLTVVGSARPGSHVPVVWAVPLAFTFWLAAGRVAADLSRVDRTADGEVAASTISRIGGSFLAGLILLFLLLAIGPGRLAYLLAGVYAVMGVSALAWLQYRVRRRQWDRGGAQVRGRLGHHWLLSALALLTVVALLAVLTPTTVLLGVAGAVWHAVGPALAQPVVGLLGQTNIRYQRYQGGGVGGGHTYGGGGQVPQLQPGREVGSAVSWTAFLLWIPAVVVLTYLGQAYWRHRHHGVPWRVGLLGPLLAAWRRLQFVLTWSLDVANAHLPDQLAVLLPGAGREVPGGLRRRFGRLSPRERIGLYYSGVLLRARRGGIPCPRWKTPREYVPVLGPAVGDAHGNFAQLSDLFVEARYSLHELSDRRADEARTDARRVRAALGSVREPGPPTSSGSS